MALTQTEKQRRYFERRKDTHRRTTLLLDNDAYRRLEDLSASTGKARKDIVSEAIREYEALIAQSVAPQ